jgi:carbon-monoxide dehydrogenase large subunit
VTEMHVGKPVRRVEDAALLTGTGRYVDDIVLPGMLEAAFVRSPHPHALIRSIDTAAARALPGVHAVLAHADIAPLLSANRIPPDNPNMKVAEFSRPPVIPENEVTFAGEIVAMIVADSRYIAEDAAALVDVAYEALPAVSDCRTALAPGTPTAHHGAPDNVVTRFVTEYGDCASAFAAAPHTLQLSLKQHRGAAHPMEGRGVVARHDANAGELTVWSSTQGTHKLRNILVDLFGRSENDTRVLVPDVGGAFGAKHIVYSEEILVPAASLLLGRPVKWFEDRREHFVAAVQERDQYWDLEAAFDDEGRLLGLRGEMIHDQGSYTLLGINVPHNSSIAVPGPYVLKNYRLEVAVVATNRVGTVSLRGAGYPEGAYAMERVMDSIARHLGLDRAEVRRRNLVPADRMPYELPLRARDGSRTAYESGDFPKCQELALEAADYAGFPARRDAARREGRFLGIGVANTVKITGRGPFESGMVRISPSGRVTVFTGAMPMGQGMKTAFAQICADQLGVDPADITVVAGDTAVVSLGIGGFGSRQTVNAGSSVHIAAREVREKALKVAAHMLEVAEADLELVAGRVRVKGADISVPLEDVAKALSGALGYSRPKDVPPGLESDVNFEPTGLTYGNAVHVVEVEVDTGTGAVEIKRYVVVNDSGNLINPQIVEGQIIGGVAHGIGNALYEWMGYDDSGQPVTTTFAEYLLPTAGVVPHIEVIHHVTPSTVNPLGVKGVGEAGVIPAAPAIAAAVEDALSSFGIEIRETPITPPRIVALVAASGP